MDFLIERIDFFINKSIHLCKLYVSYEYPFHWKWFVSYVLIGFIFYFLMNRKKSQKLSLLAPLKALFPKKCWLSKTAIMDYKIFTTNIFIIAFISTIAGEIFFNYKEINQVNNAVMGFFGIEPGILISGPVNIIWFIILFELIYMLALDLYFYIAHYLLHRVPWLWEFHKLHHTATELNFLVNFRGHVIEDIVRNISHFGVMIVVYFFYIGLFGPIPNYWALTSIPFFRIIYYFFVHFRHSDIWLTYPGILNHIFISPAHHQIHHSIEDKHIGRNLGQMTTLFDRLFGTYYHPTKEREFFRMGLDDEKDDWNDFSVWKVHALPFIRIYQSIVRFYRNRFPNRNSFIENKKSN